MSHSNVGSVVMEVTSFSGTQFRVRQHCANQTFRLWKDLFLDETAAITSCHSVSFLTVRLQRGACMYHLNSSNGLLMQSVGFGRVEKITNLYDTLRLPCVAEVFNPSPAACL